MGREDGWKWGCEEGKNLEKGFREEEKRADEGKRARNEDVKVM